MSESAGQAPAPALTQSHPRLLAPVKRVRHPGSTPYSEACVGTRLKDAQNRGATRDQRCFETKHSVDAGYRIIDPMRPSGAGCRHTGESRIYSE